MEHAAIERLLDLLERDDTAPTTVRDRAQARDVHIADSLSGLELPAVRDARRVADLGAGAGFPGLVLAAALPDAHVALVERTPHTITSPARLRDVLAQVRDAGYAMLDQELEVFFALKLTIG